MYTFDELGMDDDKGGDTALCPFDCDCCEFAGIEILNSTDKIFKVSEFKLRYQSVNWII